jgi:hypothetical protein
LTVDGPDLKAMAVATPADSKPGGSPLEIRKTLTAAWGTLEYARAKDWARVAESVARITKQVVALDGSQEPPRVMTLLHKSLTSLQAAAQAHKVRQAEQACVDVAQSAPDLEARNLPPETIEVARFHLHTQQLRVAAAAGSYGRVNAEVAALEWIQDRLGFDKDRAMQVDDAMAALRTAIDGGNLPAAADHATRIASVVRDLSVR